MSGPGGSLDDPIAPAAKKRRVVCESCSLVGHVTRKSQKCKYSTNVKSKFYGYLPPAEVETAKLQNNEQNNEQHGELVSFCTHALKRVG
jgi:hypothetical protein